MGTRKRHAPAERLTFSVRMGDGRYLLLDHEGEAERIEDRKKATRFIDFAAAEKAAWGFQASPHEEFAIEARRDEPLGEIPF